MKQTNNKLPAVPSTPSSRKRVPRQQPRVKTGAKAGTPRPARARPVPWDPEPIFRSLVKELHFDPMASL